MPNILTEIYTASPNIQKAGGKRLVKKTAKKPATKKPATKKPATKKPATKKPTTKKSTAKKPATKKLAVTKKSAAKKTVATKKVTRCPPGCVKKPVKTQKGGGNKPINLQQAVQVLRDYYNNKYE